METNELVKKIKQGDSSAFEELYYNFAQRIFRYIRIKIQNRQEAEDLLQEIFVKAYRGIASLSLENLNFSAWLYRVSSNTINDYFRKKYRAPETVAIDENFDLASDASLYKGVELNSDVGIVKAAFNRLPPLYRQVLELRFIQDFSPNEVAGVLHKSNLAVRLLQYRALKKVRLILRRQNHYPAYERIKKIAAF